MIRRCRFDALGLLMYSVLITSIQLYPRLRTPEPPSPIGTRYEILLFADGKVFQLVDDRWLHGNQVCPLNGIGGAYRPLSQAR